MQSKHQTLRRGWVVLLIGLSVAFSAGQLRAAINFNQPAYFTNHLEAFAGLAIGTSISNPPPVTLTNLSTGTVSNQIDLQVAAGRAWASNHFEFLQLQATNVRVRAVCAGGLGLPVTGGVCVGTFKGSQLFTLQYTAAGDTPFSLAGVGETTLSLTNLATNNLALSPSSSGVVIIAYIFGPGHYTLVYSNSVPVAGGRFNFDIAGTVPAGLELRVSGVIVTASGVTLLQGNPTLKGIAATGMLDVSLGVPTGVESGLGMVRAGNDLLLQWPTNLAGYFVQTTTNPAAGNWTTLPGLPVISNGFNVIHLGPPLESMRLFRLAQ